jgi:tRNA(His) guanylyltransferase
VNDGIGIRMKGQYEDRTRYFLPRRSYTVLRVDGKAFHSYTRRRSKPFDMSLEESMDLAAITLCSEAQGVRFAYGQSDEYSFLLADFDTIHTQAWFDGNLQKICSVSASVFTASFNEMDRSHSSLAQGGAAFFDCRVFNIPDPVEVENYFVWRQQDATRNSILSLGQAHHSPKQMHGKNTTEIQDMLHGKGVNWNDLPTRHKRGRCIVKVTEDRGQGDRSRWAADLEIPIFTQERDYLVSKIPQYELSTPKPFPSASGPLSPAEVRKDEQTYALEVPGE